MQNLSLKKRLRSELVGAPPRRMSLRNLYLHSRVKGPFVACLPE